MHHDPGVYAEPEKFIPERWAGEARPSDKTFAPFSRGTRSCLGM